MASRVDLLLFVLLGVLLCIPEVHGQNQSDSGFISIDCGLVNSSYVDPETNITYVSDEDFVDTGNRFSVAPQYLTSNQRHLWDLRSFPEGNRNCYKITVIRAQQYLIRADFLYGNYDGKDDPPEFDLYIGPNVWESVRLLDESNAVYKEMAYTSLSSYLQICLVNTNKGIPFVSAIELRPLKNHTYNLFREDTENVRSGLVLFARWNLAPLTNQTIRYIDDAMDRRWTPYNQNDWLQSSSEAVNTSSNFRLPLIVAKTAATPLDPNGSLNFTLEIEKSSSKCHAYFHFAELKKLKRNESRILNIFVNGEEWFNRFEPEYLRLRTVFSVTVIGKGEQRISIAKHGNSTHPPILNALEVYTVKELPQAETQQTNVDAIMNIKGKYGLQRNWQGDPCVPNEFLWKGLICSDNGVDPPNITSLDLSSSGLTGEIPSYLVNLTMIQQLDLSNNSLSGAVPNFLSKLLHLKTLNLRKNMLTGPLPEELISRSNRGLLLLSVDDNLDPCATHSCGKKNVIVPIVASVASLFAVIALLWATFHFCKRRNQNNREMIRNFNEGPDFLETNARQFSYSEISRMTNKFKRVLGKGSFGIVYHGFLDDTEVAVKMLSISSVDEGFQEFAAEVKILLKVHHGNLTSLIGYCFDESHMGLVFEFMANGHLGQHLSEDNPNILTWEERMRIAKEAAQGLEYLHHGCKPPIVHRDVKCANILLNDKFRAKLADFGLCKAFPVDGATHVSTLKIAGTLGYLDPEYYAMFRLTEKSDVFSFGVVLLEIITGKPPIIKADDNYMNHISMWVQSRLQTADIEGIIDPRLQGDFDMNSAEKAIELAMICLSRNSSERPFTNHVVICLNDCLSDEIARKRNADDRSESQDSANSILVGSFAEEIQIESSFR